MSRFLKILVTITIAIHAPFVVAAWSLFDRLGVAWPANIALAGSAMVAGVVLFLGRAKKLMADTPRPFTSILLVDLPYYIHWSACVFSVIPSIVYLVVAPILDLAHGVPIAIHRGFFMWTYAAGLVVCGYGVTLRRWWFQIRRVDLPVHDLDPRLDGYTIAHLSDLHIGAYTPLWWGMRWARAANDANVDMVVVTGDMVTSGVAFHDDIAKLIGSMRGKDGVFACMGNHDYFGEGEPLVSLLQMNGVDVLRNEGKIIERNGAQFFLAAIDDTWTRRADMKKALEARPSGVTTVLLSHDPDRFVHAAKERVDVVLSGHTHGGQIAMPFIPRHINASKLAHRFHLGKYTSGRSTLYVHPGLGTTGPPIRVGVAPAVVLLTLRAATTAS